MNFFNNNRMFSGLPEDMQRIAGTIMGICGPILSVGLVGLFIFFFVKKIIELNSAEDEQRKKEIKKSLVVLVLSSGLIAFSVLIVTAVFYATNSAAENLTPVASTTNPKQLVKGMYEWIKTSN